MLKFFKPEALGNVLDRLLISPGNCKVKITIYQMPLRRPKLTKGFSNSIILKDAERKSEIFSPHDIKFSDRLCDP